MWRRIWSSPNTTRMNCTSAEQRTQTARGTLHRAATIPRPPVHPAAGNPSRPSPRLKQARPAPGAGQQPGAGWMRAADALVDDAGAQAAASGRRVRFISAYGTARRRRPRTDQSLRRSADGNTGETGGRPDRRHCARRRRRLARLPAPPGRRSCAEGRWSVARAPVTRWTDCDRGPQADAEERITSAHRAIEIREKRRGVLSSRPAWTRRITCGCRGTRGELTGHTIALLRAWRNPPGSARRGGRPGGGRVGAPVG